MNSVRLVGERLFASMAAGTVCLTSYTQHPLRATFDQCSRGDMSRTLDKFDAEDVHQLTSTL
jgi:hypothetical protein